MLTGFLRALGPTRVFGTIAALSLGLSACGGGSSYGNSSTPLPPAAGANLSSTSPAAASPTATAANGPAVMAADLAKVGRVLTDPNGMTLYTFKPDTAGMSACTASCATTWPPLTTTVANPVKPDGLAGDLAIITRDDGTKQVTYNGQPIYLFSGDKAAGDANGQGIGGVWFVASAQASSATTAPTSATPLATAVGVTPAAPAPAAATPTPVPADTPTPIPAAAGTPTPGTSPAPTIAPTRAPATATPPPTTATPVYNYGY